LRFTMPAMLYSIVVALFAVLVRHPLASVMGIPNDSDIVVWLAAQLPLWTLGQFAVNGLMGIGQNWSRTAIAGVTTAMNVGINLVFIPRFSWKAAAAASLIADALLAALAWRALFVGQRARNREIDVRRRQQQYRARFRRFETADGSVRPVRTETRRPTG
jgi:O-antigen/teichoic acid export membrane protein